MITFDAMLANTNVSALFFNERYTITVNQRHPGNACMHTQAASQSFKKKHQRSIASSHRNESPKPQGPASCLLN